MIAMSLDAVERNKLFYLAAQNYPGENERWAEAIKKSILGMTQKSEDVVLFGHEKDESSFYLKMFPHWELIETGSHGDVNATDIRQALFEDKLETIKDQVSAATYEFLCRFRNSQEFAKIV